MCLKERDVCKENKIKCNKCNEQFQIKNNEFKSNEALNKVNTHEQNLLVKLPAMKKFHKI